MRERSAIVYMNQVRPVVGDHEWADACCGHKDLYDAIRCKERSTAALQRGEIDDGGLPGSGRALLHLGNILRQEGLKFEARIIKRTAVITEEVIEEASEIT